MTTHTTATGVDAIVLDVADPDRAHAFYTDTFGLGTRVQVRAGQPATSGFRAFTVSLVVSGPGSVDALIGAALDRGATTLKAPAKSFWGYGGVVRTPDGAIWKVASSAKKDTGPATRHVDDVVLLLGVADVKASKRFYVERGLAVARSFGGKYAEFTAPTAGIKLALYPRRALAKDAGLSPDGTGSARMSIRGADEAFTDPDGFDWQTAAA